MAVLSFNSTSSFLPREEFFSDSESSCSKSPETLGQKQSALLSPLASPPPSPPPCPKKATSTVPTSLNPHGVAASTSSNTPIRPSVFEAKRVRLSNHEERDDAISVNYKQLIESRTIAGIYSIHELLNWKLDERETIIGCVFGIIKSVRESKRTKFKYVTIVDPTCESGIELEAFGMHEKIAVGQMMKTCNLKVQKTSSTVAFMFTPATKITFFPLFSYDYDNPQSDERNKALTETRFSSSKDREICYLLEKWFSFKIINGSKLSNLPGSGEFVDLCCQVLAFSKTHLCINAVVWDTTSPKYQPLLGPEGKWPSGFEYINHDFYPVAYDKYFTLVIWKEQKDQAQHYDTFKCIDLSTGSDLVVLFNLQVIEDTNYPGKASLVMRSRLSWGKAVRLCHRKSILGQLFGSKLEEYRKNFRRKLGLSDLDETRQDFQAAPEPSPHSPIESTRIEESTKIDYHGENVDYIDISHVELPHSETIQKENLQLRKDSESKQPESPVNIIQQQDDTFDTLSSDFDMDFGDDFEVNDNAGIETSNKRPLDLKDDEQKILKSGKEPKASQRLTTITEILPKKTAKRAQDKKTAELVKTDATNPPLIDLTKPSTSKKVPLAEKEKILTKTQESEISLLEKKAKGYISWKVLTSHSINKLKEFYLTTQEDYFNDDHPLTREERLKFIQLAIDFVTKSKKAHNDNKSGVIYDSDDSIPESPFPIIDRVKYFS